MSQHTMPERIEQLNKLKDEALHAGSERSVERQHAKGKLLARERIQYLLDPGSFHELDMLARHRVPPDLIAERPYTDGVITGWGTIDGRKVFVFSQDFTVFGGALGEVFAEKIHKVMDLALSVGAPLIGLNDGAGARIQEGVVSLASYGGIFHRNVKASGVTPQISVILGPCAGGAVYSPAMTDFIFMVDESSHMFITGPDVVKTVTGEEVTLEELGGAKSHASKSGVATFVAPDEQACLDDVRFLFSFLPSNNLEAPPHFASTDSPDRLTPALSDLMPASSNQPYDMKAVIRECVDDGEFFEYFPRWAGSIVCGFARLDGHPVGSGRQPADGAGRRARHRVLREGGPLRADLRRLQHPAGHLRRRPRLPARRRPGVRRHHPPRRQAALRLLRVDGPPHPGHHPQGLRRGVRGDELQVHRGRPGLRLALGRAGRHGPAGRGRDPVPPGAADRGRPRWPRRNELVDEYTERFANPYVAAERGFVDDVIDPAETRVKLIAGLEMLRSKREELPHRKHGNIPL